MEGNRNYEPRWATYTKAAVFLTPAISLWTFSVLFLLPKLKHICREAGVALPSVYQTTGFIADNMVPMTGAVMLLLGLLEWRWSRWPEFRRISLSSAVFLLNGAILALITLMVLFALLAAPALMQHAK